jgi:hypothetical protein
MQEEEEEEERETFINSHELVSVKVGKHIALSGNTASGPAWEEGGRRRGGGEEEEGGGGGRGRVVQTTTRGSFERQY